MTSRLLLDKIKLRLSIEGYDMKMQFLHQTLLATLLLCQLSICLGTEASDANDSSKYLDAVREFADNVLKYGRDTYGPKHTPLFVDGLMVRDPNNPNYGKDGVFKPVEWISPEGERWILSNLASQQNLFRTLDGLTKITGDPKYKQAAMEAIKYAFENLRSPNGLLYWGNTAAYDTLGDRPCGNDRHVFKLYFPYYELMWQVDPRATEELIQAMWAAHVLDWSNLDIDRIASLYRLSVPKGWQQEYKGGPVFFEGGSSMVAIGFDLFYAAAMLSKLSGQEEPLTWAKRLAYRYIETREPKVGISTHKYTLPSFSDNSEYPLADDLRRRMVHERTFFPPNIEQRINSESLKQKQAFFTVSPGVPLTLAAGVWTSYFLVGELSGDEGREFTRWVLEELTARGNVAYRKIDNVWIPMSLDGTILEGYVYKKDPKGRAFKSISAVPRDLWGYALAYRVTSDEFMWEMARNIAGGNGLGDIGAVTEGDPKLQILKDHFDPYTLLSLLELYRETEKTEFLQAAQEVGDNILSLRHHNGFFLPSSKHIYAKLDAIEALALLHIEAAMRGKVSLVPQVWPGRPLFNYRYRDKGIIDDDTLIYTLTESSEPPRSLQEAAACGDIEELKGLIAQGVDINGGEAIELYTALHRAVINGHKEVVVLLLSKGAQVDATDSYPNATTLGYAAEKGYKDIAELLIAHGADVNAKREGYPAGDTPLHSAVRAGHKDIVELLIDKGADVNTKNSNGQTPLDIAVANNSKDIIELLLAKGADTSIHVAVQVGDLARVRTFLEEGGDVNVRDDSGQTLLHYAVKGGQKDVTELLLSKGADINAKDKSGYTPLYYAIMYNNKDMVRLLVAKGADVNLKPEKGYPPPLHYSVWMEDIDLVELLVANGAKFDVKDQNGWTAFRHAASQGNRELIEFFVSKGADVSSFHMAACVGDLARVKNFVEQGTDVDTKDELGWTPLYWATSTGQEDVAEFLIAKGANVNAKTNDGTTILHQAAKAGAGELVKLFISRGADVNAKNKYGNTPLHSAASAGNRAAVELLIAKGANVDAKSKYGLTPLFSAVLRRHKDVVEILLFKGADADAKDTQGRTVLWYAEQTGYKEIVELLRKHVAKD
jgi:ankyrin repeat protein